MGGNFDNAIVGRAEGTSTVNPQFQVFSENESVSLATARAHEQPSTLINYETIFAARERG